MIGGQVQEFAEARVLDGQSLRHLLPLHEAGIVLPQLRVLGRERESALHLIKKLVDRRNWLRDDPQHRRDQIGEYDSDSFEEQGIGLAEDDHDDRGKDENWQREALA